MSHVHFTVALLYNLTIPRAVGAFEHLNTFKHVF